MKGIKGAEMYTMESLRKKIQSAEDLYGIVKTMKTLAAVSIRHYEKAVRSVLEYNKTIERGFVAVLSQGSIDILVRNSKEEEKTAAVVFGSDQGLCGGFNDRIVSYAMDILYQQDDQKTQKMLLCVGQRAFALLEQRGHPVESIFPVPGSLTGVTSIVQKLVVNLDELQLKQNVSRVIVFHNRLLSTSSYEPNSLRVLPLDREWYQKRKEIPWESRSLPVFTMKRDRLISALVKQYVFMSLYRAFVESMASENAGRLSSMQTAERNIEDTLDDFNALYRNERQSSITSELIDIVSGYEAIRSD